MLLMTFILDEPIDASYKVNEARVQIILFQTCSLLIINNSVCFSF